MGSGLSSNHHRRSSASLRQPPPPPAAAPALVVEADGSLREFAPASSPVSASDVLDGAGSSCNAFVCSSDALYFDADVPALGADELLRPGQIYFVLPVEMLGRPLSSADMAALAVRASDALAVRARSASNNNGRARRRGRLITAKARVVPAAHHAAGGDEEVNEKLNQRTLGAGFETASRSPAGAAKGSVPAARPPMRRALSTIMEDTD